MINYIQEIIENFDFNSVQNDDDKAETFARKTLSVLNSVDLGLPSGTLWCEYNLGCDWKKLSDKQYRSKVLDWYGNYYAWGEITPKENTDYVWKKYKWCNVVEVEETGGQATRKPWTQIVEKPKLTKYCVDAPDSFKKGNEYEYLCDKIDNLSILLPEDDAAYQSNDIFRIPTKKQCEELLAYTTQKFVENYQNIKNLNGVVLTSKINKRKLFIPAAGSYVSNGDLSKRKAAGVTSSFWTSTLDTGHSNSAITCDMYFSKNVFKSGLQTMMGLTLREQGCSIRPVLNL